MNKRGARARPGDTEYAVSCIFPEPSAVITLEL
jgi:hypothetical protein